MRGTPKQEKKEGVRETLGEGCKTGWGLGPTGKFAMHHCKRALLHLIPAQGGASVSLGLALFDCGLSLGDKEYLH